VGACLIIYRAASKPVEEAETNPRSCNVVLLSELNIPGKMQMAADSL
jgi:hypothetical protein